MMAGLFPPLSRRAALRSIGRAALCAGVIGTGAGSSSAGARQLPVLDEKQRGQLAFIDHLSRQLPSDWAHMGSAEPGQGGFDAYRYQLAMMSYALSLAHYHHTPAWPEHHQAVSRRLLDKMMQFDVWGFWELTSRGVKALEPDLVTLRESQLDPVKLQNIMYSGHLFQMVTTHHMLFDDHSFEKPGSILFDYRPVARGMGPQRFEYDVHSLAQVLIDQFRINQWRGIECEPNAIFPECNQHPLLGFKLYDRRYGSEHFPFISTRFREQYDQLGYLDRKSGSVMAFFLVKQEKVVRADSAWSDGWTGTFLHGWDRAEPESCFPLQRDRFLVRLPDGTATVRAHDQDHDYSHGHGFMAALAAEVGDLDSRDALLAYADAYWNPTWDGPALRYPREDRYRLSDDGANVWRRVQPMTGNGLIALARMGGRDRLYTMFAQPIDKTHFARPRLAGVDYPTVQVAAAGYEGGALRIELRRARDAVAADMSTSFRIENVDPRKEGFVLRDGKPFLTFADGRVRMLPGGGEARIDPAGAIVISTPIGRDGVSFRLTEKGANEPA
ncbi:hypothetical protein [Sphingomonas sp. Root50]|uniref:linalool dehydratase/isomerase domain-containing protein n=1 Tax=Sphingomonas sp. Root50 TaxID=1736551 RepID=UPI000A74F571|nr:hypothetical protein [Sphingomonas sp. Root50]